ncbi:hypothetical protein THRCLA_22051 [Thraustotheca clavata]|uniref:Uncharacterized protein n=1 Tax=Thraustotheca clavata TaxID=74557 RepID=A0A1V9ZD41_9STRA|nr:hypothetical protein THRCLA_22051 [Thraustotheca clavata]
MVVAPVVFTKSTSSKASPNLPKLAVLTGVATYGSYSMLQYLKKSIEFDLIKVIQMEMSEGAASRRACFEFDKHNERQQAQTFNCLYENLDNQHVFNHW